MRNINKVFIIGRLTSDFDEKHVRNVNGFTIAEVSVAVNDSKKNQAGQWEDVAQFIPVKMLGKLAENIARYAGKGVKVAVEGKLQVDTWQDKQTGQNRSKIYVLADNVELCQPPNGNQNQPQSGDYQNQQNTNQQLRNVGYGNQQQYEQDFQNYSDFPEDIPFN